MKNDNKAVKALTKDQLYEKYIGLLSENFRLENLLQQKVRKIDQLESCRKN